MQPSPILIAVSTALFSIFIGKEACGSPIVTNEVVKSIVVLDSRETKICATGFFDEHARLITSLHAFKHLCPNDNCQNLRIRQAKALGTLATEPVLLGNLTQAISVPSLDISILNFERAPKGIFKTTANIKELGDLYVLGHPNCNKLELSKGIANESTNLTLELSATGKPGSSGSPVFGDDLLVYGVATSSASLRGAIRSRLIGGSFPLKAGKFMEFNSLLDEINALLKYYQEHIQQLTGFSRFMGAYDFMTRMEALKAKVASSPEKELLAPLFLAWGDKSLEATDQSDALSGSITQLIHYYNDEYLGGPTFEGLEKYAIKMCLLLGCVTVVFSLAIGYVAGKVRGSRFGLRS